jgi:hypothetical protein
MKTNNRIKSDSVKLSFFLQRDAKKVAKYTPQFMRALTAKEKYENSAGNHEGRC